LAQEVEKENIYILMVKMVRPCGKLNKNLRYRKTWNRLAKITKKPVGGVTCYYFLHSLGRCWFIRIAYYTLLRGYEFDSVILFGYNER